MRPIGRYNMGKTTAGSKSVANTRDLNLRIGIIVRRRRKRKRLTQEDLARAAVSVSQAMVSQIERGGRNARLNLATLERISIALAFPSLSSLIAEAERAKDLGHEMRETQQLIAQLKRRGS